LSQELRLFFDEGLQKRSQVGDVNRMVEESLVSEERDPVAAVQCLEVVAGLVESDCHPSFHLLLPRSRLAGDSGSIAEVQLCYAAAKILHAHTELAYDQPRGYEGKREGLVLHVQTISVVEEILEEGYLEECSAIVDIPLASLVEVPTHGYSGPGTELFPSHPDHAIHRRRHLPHLQKQTASVRLRPDLVFCLTAAADSESPSSQKTCSKTDPQQIQVLDSSYP
jgi:hypothetical protein